MTPWEPFWDRIKKGLLLIGIGFLALLATLEAIGEERRSAWLEGVLVGAFIAYFLVVDRWMWRFPCPRCGSDFFRPPGRWVNSVVVQECWACGLPKWGDPESARSRQ